MNKLTLKDYVKFASPCLECGQKVNLDFLYVDKNTMVNNKIIYTLYPDHVVLQLKIKYKKSLNLKIYHKTNIIECHKLNELLDFIKEFDINIKTYCKNCGFVTGTSNLIFNTLISRIDPFTIDILYGHLNHNYNNCQIYKNHNMIEFYYKENLQQPAPVVISVKEFDLNKLKNKASFFKKIQKYKLFL